MAAFKTFLRVIMPLIFLISASSSVAAPVMPSSQAIHMVQTDVMADCHDKATQTPSKTGKTNRGDPADSCCGKTCACTVNHCQPTAQAPDDSKSLPEPSANTRYEAFSKRLLSAIREQVKPPPKS